MNKESGAFLRPGEDAPGPVEKHMLKAISGFASEEEFLATKKRYIEKYPDQLEGVELLFGIRDLLAAEAEVRLLSKKYEGRKKPQELYDKIKEMAEYNFLLTHFVIQNGDNREFLEVLWRTLEKAGGNPEEEQSLQGLRRGILSQAATFKTFRKLGMQPELSKPSDDAFKSIDLWSDARHAVQIKGGYGEDVELVETEEIPAVNIRTENGGRTRLFASKYDNAIQDFRLKIDDYRKHENKPDLKGYFVIIPHSKIDDITGEPDAELVETLRAKLGLPEAAKAA